MSAQPLAARSFASLPQLIAEHAQERPLKLAIVCGADSLTYSELDSATSRIAASLQRDGILQYDAVAMVSSTTLPASVVFLGALRAGCVVTPIAPSSSPDQIATMISDSGAKIVFVDTELESTLAPIPVKMVSLEKLERWIGPVAVQPEVVAIKPNDVFNIIYSSGTTGTPKGIVQTHAMRWTQIIAVDVGLSEAVSLVATPLYSNTTLVSFLPALAYGGTVVLLSKFDAKQYLQTAAFHRVTHAMLVPVQYQRIMALPEFSQFDLSAFRFKFCTSAPFSPQLKADVLSRWPGALWEIYGMTEGGGSCLLQANEFPNKLNTVGRPTPDSDIRLVDENGQQVATGEIGEVVGRSKTMMAGYHGRPDATDAASWMDAQGNRFMRQGDLGRFDEDGFLTLLGRTKDMIISGGFNVYPPDIEAVVLQYPGVETCAVIGVPSDAWGETPYLFYVPHRGAAIDTKELLNWVNSRVGKTQRISAARSIEALPFSHIGKVLKRELRDIFEADSAAQNPGVSPS